MWNVLLQVFVWKPNSVDLALKSNCVTVARHAIDLYISCCNSNLISRIGCGQTCGTIHACWNEAHIGRMNSKISQYKIFVSDSKAPFSIGNS